MCCDNKHLTVKAFYKTADPSSLLSSSDHVIHPDLFEYRLIPVQHNGQTTFFNYSLLYHLVTFIYVDIHQYIFLFVDTGVKIG